MDRMNKRIERMTDSAYEILNTIGEYGKAEFLTVIATVLSAYADVHEHDAVRMSKDVTETLKRVCNDSSVKPHKVSIN